MTAPALYAYFASKDDIYDAMFADGQRAMLELDYTPGEGEPVTRAELRHGARVFFDFCTADPVRYQLMFQRVVPGFVPSEESYALAVRNYERFSAAVARAGVTDPRHLDLWTALVTGLTDQQISNDPGGDRWGRLLDEAVDLLCDHAGLP